jgi:hypothetical protein
VLLTQLRQQLAALPQQDPTRAPASRRRRNRNAASSWSSCWPRSKSASTKKTPAPRSATSAPPRARRSTPSTTTRCAARWKTRARRISPNRGKKLYGELVMILTVNHDGRVLATESCRARATAARHPCRGHCPRRRPLRPLRPGHARQGRPDRRGLALVHPRPDAADRCPVSGRPPAARRTPAVSPPPHACPDTAALPCFPDFTLPVASAHT